MHGIMDEKCNNGCKAFTSLFFFLLIMDRPSRPFKALVLGWAL